MPTTKTTTWPSFTVRYWDCAEGVNQCFGNSKTWAGKARTATEAVRKFYAKCPCDNHAKIAEVGVSE